MNEKKSLVNRIHGWLPKEPHLPAARLEGQPKRFFSQRNVLILVVGVLVCVVVVGSVLFFLVFSNLFQSFSVSAFSNPVGEAQNTLSAYIDALNAYNATAAWNLLSPNMQISYQTLQNFNDSFVGKLQTSGWHAQIVSDSSGYGTIASWTPLHIQNSWTMPVDLRVTLDNASSTYKTINFSVKSYAYSNNQPTNWKIDSKFTVAF